MTTVLFVAVQPVLCRVKQQLQITPLDTERSCFFFSCTFSPCFFVRWRMKSTSPLRKQLPCNFFHHSLNYFNFFYHSQANVFTLTFDGEGLPLCCHNSPTAMYSGASRVSTNPFSYWSHWKVASCCSTEHPLWSAIERTNKCIDSNRLWCNHGTIQQLLTEKSLYSNQCPCYEYTKATILAFH